MGVYQSFFTIALATLGLSLSPVAANAIGFTTVSSEAEQETLMSQPAFVAAGEFGSIVLNNDDKTHSQADFNWLNGEKQPFSISYDGSTIRYTVGEQSLETKTEGFFQDIFLYTKATEAYSRVILKNLLLTDSETSLSISGIGASYPNNAVNIFWIQDIKKAFTLTGNALLGWLNPPQNPANLTYQIQVGNVATATDAPDVNQGQTEPVASPTPTPETETSTGTDWLSWLPGTNGEHSSERYCGSHE